MRYRAPAICALALAATLGVSPCLAQAETSAEVREQVAAAQAELEGLGLVRIVSCEHLVVRRYERIHQSLLYEDAVVRRAVLVPARARAPDVVYVGVQAEVAREAQRVVVFGAVLEAFEGSAAVFVPLPREGAAGPCVAAYPAPVAEAVVAAERLGQHRARFPRRSRGR